MDLGRVKGGVETYLERLAAVLKGDADFYCICILPELARGLRADGVRVILLPRFGAWGKPLGFLITVFLLPLIVFPRPLYLRGQRSSKDFCPSKHRNNYTIQRGSRPVYFNELGQCSTIGLIKM